MSVRFSILVVTLNSGGKLKKTVDSIFCQNYDQIEVIVKDGLSKDGSIEALRKERGGDERLRIVESEDRGIYEAMNQAVALARGDYLLFLNCGDTLAEKTVLERVAEKIEARGAARSAGKKALAETAQGAARSAGKEAAAETARGGARSTGKEAAAETARGAERSAGKEAAAETARGGARSTGREVLAEAAQGAARSAGKEAAAHTAQEAAGLGKDRAPAVYYGDTFCERTGALVHASPEITGFTCYRNIPCHQSCFYDRRLFEERQYEEEYRIRADYEHFLWCYYRAGAEMVYLDMTVSAYEGGGASEEEANRKRDREEHRQITALYMKKRELLRYRLIMALTLAPLRRFLGEDPRFSRIYNGVKDKLLGQGKKRA